MPAELILVDKYPQEAESTKEPGDYSRYKA